MVVVAVGDVGLLEKGAEGRLWKEGPDFIILRSLFPESLALGAALGLATEWEK